MRRSPFIDGLISALFVLYCIEAGAFLALAPWREVWLKFAAWFPDPTLHPILLHPLTRGAVTGFGLVHLVWGIHDLERLLARRHLRAKLRESETA
jgi:hypothetical protein